MIAVDGINLKNSQYFTVNARLLVLNCIYLHTPPSFAPLPLKHARTRTTPMSRTGEYTYFILSFGRHCWWSASSNETYLNARAMAWPQEITENEQTPEMLQTVSQTEKQKSCISEPPTQPFQSELAIYADSDTDHTRLQSVSAHTADMCKTRHV